MRLSPSYLLRNPIVRIAALLIAIGSMVAFGIIGVGRGGGFAKSGFDMAFLYVAGRTWWQGLDAYSLVARQAATGPQAADIYAFAYPPHIAPLSLFLGLFPLEKARVVMVMLNILAAGFLSFFCVQLLRRGEVTQLNDSGSTAQWWIPTLVLGNPFTTHILWMGQTTLIAAAALTASWYFSRRDRWLIAGILLALASVKPQLSLLILLWFLFERRWRLLAVAAVSGLLASVVPMIIAGPINVWLNWLQEIKVYKAAPFNALGFQHMVSLQDMLYTTGINIPSLLPLAIVLTGVLWWQRSKILSDDVYGLLLGTSFLLGSAHDYDLIALAPLIPLFWRHLQGDGKGTIVALALMIGMFIPQRLFRSLNNGLVSHFRVFIVLALTLWLLRLSIQQAAKIQATALTDQSLSA